MKNKQEWHPATKPLKKDADAGLTFSAFRNLRKRVYTFPPPAM
jgi:hypothetical protein